MAAVREVVTGSTSPITIARSTTLLDAVDGLRLAVGIGRDDEHQAGLGQYFTPVPIARFMASLFPERAIPHLCLLDPGAGIGILTAALIEALCSWAVRPSTVTVTAYEIDDKLIPTLHQTMDMCREICWARGITFHYEVRKLDFVEHVASMFNSGMFAPQPESYHCVIMNPPYFKINTDSPERRALRSVGMETSNIYAGFVALAVRLLLDGGDLVAITPRSFCNGQYFRPLRRDLLSRTALKHVHLFARRNQAFRQDDVLQETIIFRATGGEPQPETLRVSESAGLTDEDMTEHDMPFARVVYPNDQEYSIHLLTDGRSQHVADLMDGCGVSLHQLNLQVSTGRVVDFRARSWLRTDPEEDTVPLIYPEHCVAGGIAWPKVNSKKAQAIVDNDETEALLVPAGVYVLVKRFSAKEERRRIVATIYEPDAYGLPGEYVGFENHLNYYHCDGKPLSLTLARGVAAFLNSTVVDEHFRSWSGSTQVNATDLRTLHYPSREALHALGEHIRADMPEQDELDQLVHREIFGVIENGNSASDPVDVKRKSQQALDIIKALGFPRQQQNERSALTLMALSGMRVGISWSESYDPMLGISGIIDVIQQHYGKRYAPNTRETVRRQTIHQFLDAGLIAINPDDPGRPTTSGDTVYQLVTEALDLLQDYGTDRWEASLATYLSTRDTLAKRYARERTMMRIPVTFNDNVSLTLSPGGQNVLIREIINEFCPRFTPGGRVLYIGDTGDKFGYHDRDGLAQLGVTLEEHGKFPDLIVHYREKNWLLLIEAVTSHGPVDGKRHDELANLFKSCLAPLVFVTAFLTREAIARYVHVIDWATEVWTADATTHMIHFNGERFLGPHDKNEGI